MRAHACPGHPTKSSPRSVLDAPKRYFVKEPQRGDPYLVEEQTYEGTEMHPLSMWTSLGPGDVVYLRGPGIQDFVGTVESRTRDGLIIWIRDDLNERRAFHFRECESVGVIRRVPAKASR